MEKLIVHDPIKINHPLANKMSVQNSSHHYSTEYTSEIAFFLNNKFQTKVIEDFAEYCDGATGGDTLVYGYVPNELVESFLNKYRA
jgi:hypothetical protein